MQRRSRTAAAVAHRGQPPTAAGAADPAIPGQSHAHARAPGPRADLQARKSAWYDTAARVLELGLHGSRQTAYQGLKVSSECDWLEHSAARMHRASTCVVSSGRLSVCQPRQNCQPAHPYSCMHAASPDHHLDGSTRAQTCGGAATHNTWIAPHARGDASQRRRTPRTADEHDGWPPCAPDGRLYEG